MHRGARTREIKRELLSNGLSGLFFVSPGEPVVLCIYLRKTVHKCSAVRKIFFMPADRSNRPTPPDGTGRPVSLSSRPIAPWYHASPAIVLLTWALIASIHNRQPLPQRIPLPVWVIPDAENTWRVIDPERESMDAITDATALGSVAVASLELSSRRIGFPAAVYIRNTSALTLRPFGSAPPPELTPELRERILMAMSRQRSVPAFADLIEGDQVRVRWSWLGLAANVFLLSALLTGCLLTIRLFWLWMHNLQTMRRTGALKKGLCPVCRYSLQGLDSPVDRCPECGKTWTLPA